jgi:predicted SAM-dependent methyltransferase
MLNIGAGDTRIHPNIINLDLNESPNVDIVASASCIPFSDCSVYLVVSQEVLEHVPDPSAVLEEIYRVLRPSGLLYLQLHG